MDARMRALWLESFQAGSGDFALFWVLLLQLIRLSDSAGRSRVARMPMIAMPIDSPIKVKPHSGLMFTKTGITPIRYKLFSAHHCAFLLVVSARRRKVTFYFPCFTIPAASHAMI